jgi:hypothetical protein
LDCRHACKTCTFHDALQAGKQKEVHPPYSPGLAPAGILLSKIPMNYISVDFSGWSRLKGKSHQNFYDAPTKSVLISTCGEATLTPSPLRRAPDWN